MCIETLPTRFFYNGTDTGLPMPYSTIQIHCYHVGTNVNMLSVSVNVNTVFIARSSSVPIRWINVYLRVLDNQFLQLRCGFRTVHKIDTGNFTSNSHML